MNTEVSEGNQVEKFGSRVVQGLMRYFLRNIISTVNAFIFAAGIFILAIYYKSIHYLPILDSNVLLSLIVISAFLGILLLFWGISMFVFPIIYLLPYFKEVKINMFDIKDKSKFITIWTLSQILFFIVAGIIYVSVIKLGFSSPLSIVFVILCIIALLVVFSFGVLCLIRSKMSIGKNKLFYFMITYTVTSFWYLMMAQFIYLMTYPKYINSAEDAVVLMVIVIMAIFINNIVAGVFSGMVQQRLAENFSLNQSPGRRGLEASDRKTRQISIFMLIFSFVWGLFLFSVLPGSRVAQIMKVYHVRIDNVPVIIGEESCDKVELLIHEKMMRREGHRCLLNDVNILSSIGSEYFLEIHGQEKTYRFRVPAKDVFIMETIVNSAS